MAWHTTGEEHEEQEHSGPGQRLSRAQAPGSRVHQRPDEEHRPCAKVTQVHVNQIGFDRMNARFY